MTDLIAICDGSGRNLDVARARLRHQRLIIVSIEPPSPALASVLKAENDAARRPADRPQHLIISEGPGMQAEFDLILETSPGAIIAICSGSRLLQTMGMVAAFNLAHPTHVIEAGAMTRLPILANARLAQRLNQSECQVTINLGAEREGKEFAEHLGLAYDRFMSICRPLASAGLLRVSGRDGRVFINATPEGLALAEHLRRSTTFQRSPRHP